MITNAANNEIYPDQKVGSTQVINGKHFQDSDYCPTLTITGNTVLQSVDDSPGCTTAHPFVYASKRKYHDAGNGGS